MSEQCKDLSNFSIVHIDFDVWGGQTKLSASDLKLGQGGEIPPKKLAALGRKKIIAPEMLNGFLTLRTKAQRICLSYGMRFLNAYAVPKTKLPEIDKKLKEVEQEMIALKDDFLKNYEKAVDDWANANVDYAKAIRAAAPSREAVSNRIGFEYNVINVNPSTDIEGASDKLSKKVGNLDNDLLEEVAKEATEFFTKNLSGKTSVAVQTRMTLARIRDKVDGLSFLNNSFTPLVKLLDQTVNGYEQNKDRGRVRGAFFYQILAVTLIMSDPVKVHAYANGSVDILTMASDMMPESVPAQAQPQLSNTGTAKEPEAKPEPAQVVSEIDEVKQETPASLIDDQAESQVTEHRQIADSLHSADSSFSDDPSMDLGFDNIVNQYMPDEDFVDDQPDYETLHVDEAHADSIESSPVAPAPAVAATINESTELEDAFF